MKKESAYHVLGQLGMDLRKVAISGSWHNFSCPMAPWYHKDGIDRNPSFGVSISEDGSSRSFYRCLSCGQSGTLALLPAKLGKLRGQDPSDYQELVIEAERLEYAETIVSQEPPGWEDEVGETQPAESTKPKTLLYGSALFHPYLQTRGFGWKDAWRLGLRYDEVQQRILFPVFNNRLQLAGFNGRSVMPDYALNKKNPKSRDYNGLDKRRLFIFHPAFYNAKGMHRLILTEGAFDYARGQQAGYLGTHATMGTAITDEKITHLRDYGRPVFMFFDNDKAGMDAVYGSYNIQTGTREKRHLSWAHQLYHSVPVWICQYPESAVLDGRNDPGSLTISEFRWGVTHAKLFVGADPEASSDAHEIPF